MLLFVNYYTVLTGLKAQRRPALHVRPAQLLAGGYELKWYSNATLLAEATAQETAVLQKGNTAVLQKGNTEDKRGAIARISPLTELRGLIK